MPTVDRHRCHMAATSGVFVDDDHSKCRFYFLVLWNHGFHCGTLKLLGGHWWSLIGRSWLVWPREVCTLWFQFFGAVFASKGYPFKNIFQRYTGYLKFINGPISRFLLLILVHVQLPTCLFF